MDQYSTNAQPTLKQPLTNTQLILDRLLADVLSLY